MSSSVASSDGILAATYSLIYLFLTARSHHEAATAVKKAAKGVVVLKENLKAEGISLEEIVKWWKTKTKIEEESESSSESSESDSDSDSGSSSSVSDSSSDSSSSSSSSTSKITAKKTSKPGVTTSTTAGKSKEASSSSSSESDSSSSSSMSKIKAKKTSKPGVTTSITAGKSKEVSSSGSSESDSSSSSSSDSDSDSSSSSDSEVTSDTDAKSPKKESKPDITRLNGNSTNTTGSDPSARVVKRQKTENGTSIPTSILTDSPVPSANGKINGKKPRKSNTPFQRVKQEHVKYQDERLKDNSFIARGGSGNDYGLRANQDLIVTRGDGFRKEKNKKKRGSYRGGEITLQSHSIKFTGPQCGRYDQ